MQKFYLVKLFAFLRIRKLEKYQYDALNCHKSRLIPGEYWYVYLVEDDEKWRIDRFFAPKLGYFFLVWRKK